MSGEAITSSAPLAATRPRNNPAAFAGGAVIGALGGLIGLGGAEFRLPLLIGAFRFGALQAVILNKAMSLVVVASALPFRAAAVPFANVAAQWPIIVNLLAGSLSLAVSLPTILVGFARYSRDRSFVVPGENRRFVLVMAAGSIFGSFIGGRLLRLVPNAVLLPLLAIILGAQIVRS